MARTFLASLCSPSGADKSVPMPRQTATLAGPPHLSHALANFNSPILDTIALSNGDVLASLYPSERSIVGCTPASGRLITVGGSRLRAQSGIRAMPPVEATRDMAIDRLST
jgi:hypothetical protein